MDPPLAIAPRGPRMHPNLHHQHVYITFIYHYGNQTRPPAPAMRGGGTTGRRGPWRGRRTAKFADLSRLDSAAQAWRFVTLITVRGVLPVCGGHPQNAIFFKTIHYVIFSRYVDGAASRAHAADSPAAPPCGRVWPRDKSTHKRTFVTSVIVRSFKLMASNSRFAHLIQSSESLSDGRPRFHLLAC
jgi:hypothetical protein